MQFLNSFFIATGSNIGNRENNLILAKERLCGHFEIIAESKIYESPAVDYLNQPDFYNQVLEFKLPAITPEKTMSLLLNIESEMGRNRLIPKGPRLIDLDILFWGTDRYDSEILHIPHPRLFERSFVVLPLSELPGFKILSENFKFSFQFDNRATPLS
ncbi:MAG: 2-amino-4-hydroxy-6-hydroxymethyldihydropteridine diphosphokinase [Bacteriovorax sp.]|jgi:2-amino-4-hydroxy-6-hydroxymethyldihydropteridine diphosphokinase